MYNTYVHVLSRNALNISMVEMEKNEEIACHAVLNFIYNSFLIFIYICTYLCMLL